METCPTPPRVALRTVFVEGTVSSDAPVRHERMQLMVRGSTPTDRRWFRDSGSRPLRRGRHRSHQDPNLYSGPRSRKTLKRPDLVLDNRRLIEGAELASARFLRRRGGVMTRTTKSDASIATVAPMDWLLEGDPAIRWQTMRDLSRAPKAAVERERRRWRPRAGARVCSGSRTPRGNLVRRAVP